MDLVKKEIRILEKVFGKAHERFQLEKSCADELTFVFVGKNEEEHGITANIPVRYPQTPPVWFTLGDSEETAIIFNTLERLGVTTGTDNHILSQVKILLKELCRAFGLADPTHDLEQLVLEGSNDDIPGSSGGNKSPRPQNSDSNASFKSSDSPSSFEDYSAQDESPLDSMEFGADHDDDEESDSEFDEMDCDIFTECLGEDNKLTDENKYITRTQEDATRVMQELKNIYRSESYKKGIYSILFADESLQECNVRFNDVDKEWALYEDLVTLNEMGAEDFIFVNVKLYKYPANPPIVRIIHPTMSGCTLRPDGTVSIELLTTKGWTPEHTLEGVILEILKMLCTARVDFAETNLASEKFCKEATKYIGQTALNPAFLKTLAATECGDAKKPPALASLSYTLNILEEPDYKHMVLQVLWNDSQSNRFMCDLRMTLFRAAASSLELCMKCVLPFPACFFDPIKNSKQFSTLVQHTLSIPPLPKILEETELPVLTWQLIHWILTNPLSLEPLTANIPETVKNLQLITGLKFPTPDNKTIFMFNIVRTQPKKPFLDAKQKYRSTFAFHGSPLTNFHSIIHRGLISALNVRRAYGYGTYLSTQLETSKAYSCGYFSTATSSQNPSPYCVAICEVIKGPELKQHAGDFYVCPVDDYMQLSHIFLFKPHTTGNIFI